MFWRVVFAGIVSVFRRIKDYGERKIGTVIGCVEVRNPRILNCQRCFELSARLGSPYRKAADVLAEFLPVKSTESFVTVRHRTLSGQASR